MNRHQEAFIARDPLGNAPVMIVRLAAEPGDRVAVEYRGRVRLGTVHSVEVSHWDKNDKPWAQYVVLIDGWKSRRLYVGQNSIHHVVRAEGGVSCRD